MCVYKHMYIVSCIWVGVCRLFDTKKERSNIEGSYGIYNEYFLIRRNLDIKENYFQKSNIIGRFNL